MKQTIKQHKSIDWMSDLDSMTKEQAIEWLTENVPDGYYLDTDWGYESQHGLFTCDRLETDEEESTRESKETAAREERERQAEWIRLRREQDAKGLVESAKAADIALGIYLQKHKDNAKIDDLKNLFMALVQLEREGHPDKGAAMREVRECMEGIEDV